MNQVAKHIIFAGRVQGIGFRFTALSAANHYKLTGFVRNIRNGDVEMLAQGPPDDIDKCVQEIKKTIGSYVAEVKIEDVAFDPQYKDFKITF
jgi:acylphosphatase